MNPPADQIGTKDFQTEGFLESSEYRVPGFVWDGHPCSGRVVAESPRCHPPGLTLPDSSRQPLLADYFRLPERSRLGLKGKNL